VTPISQTVFLTGLEKIVRSFLRWESGERSPYCCA
jgi:hypothetical protein